MDPFQASRPAHSHLSSLSIPNGSAQTPLTPTATSSPVSSQHPIVCLKSGRSGSRARSKSNAFLMPWTLPGGVGRNLFHPLRVLQLGLDATEMDLKAAYNRMLALAGCLRYHWYWYTGTTTQTIDKNDPGGYTFSNRLLFLKTEVYLRRGQTS